MSRFIDNLQESKVKFVCADMPEANETMIGFMAVMAKHERQTISRRTKEALQAAKKRGVVLGNPNGAKALRWLGNRPAVQALKTRADTRARDVLPIIEDIRASGITGLNGIAAELNSRGILTARGARWWPSTVKNLLARC